MRLTKRFMSKSGAVVWAEVSTTLRRAEDGRPLYFITEMVDITARKQAEEAFSQSEGMFRAVIENSEDAILFTDATGTILYRSPTYDRLNGFTDAERLGHSIFETVHPDDLERVRRHWAELVEHPEKPYRYEYRIRHKDGTWRWIDTVERNLLGNPDVGSIVVTSRDITARKQAEEALRLRESLPHRHPGKPAWAGLAQGCGWPFPGRQLGLRPLLRENSPGGNRRPDRPGYLAPGTRRKIPGG